MTRKKVKLVWFVNYRAKKERLMKRKVELMKKMHQLSILSDVSASFIINSLNESEPMMRPSRAEVQEILERFNAMPEKEMQERVKRFNVMPEKEYKKNMMNLELYLEKSVGRLKKQIDKQQRKCEEIEVSNLTRYVEQGNSLDKLNITALQSFVWFVEEKRKEIIKTLDYCQQAHLSLDCLLNAHLSPVSLVPNQALVLESNQMAPKIEENIGGFDHDHHEMTSTKSDQLDQWFTNAMKNIDNFIETNSKVSGSESDIARGRGRGLGRGRGE